MKSSPQKKRVRKPLTPEQRDARNRHQREYGKTHPEFYKGKLANSKRWRKKNRGYDIARKTVEEWDVSDGERQKHKKKYDAWMRSLSPEDKELLRRRMNEKSKAWAKRQRNDPEYGWAFRLITGYKKNIPQEVLDAVRTFYREAMARRKAQRRAERIGALLEGCTDRQKRTILAKAKQRGISVCINKKTKGRRGKRQ